jgi:hypothetical protein
MALAKQLYISQFHRPSITSVLRLSTLLPGKSPSPKAIENNPKLYSQRRPNTEFCLKKLAGTVYP